MPKTVVLFSSNLIGPEEQEGCGEILLRKNLSEDAVRVFETQVTIMGYLHHLIMLAYERHPSAATTLTSASFTHPHFLQEYQWLLRSFH
jgi:hypothetical protein